MTSSASESALQAGALDYHLPAELVAAHPTPERDQSRLLVVDRKRGSWEHSRFSDFVGCLNSGDTVVLNRTRVRRARTPGRRSSGGRVELLWLHREDDTWKALARPSARLRPGEKLNLEHGLCVILEGKEEQGVVRLRVPETVDMEAWLTLHGRVPLPPYLRREEEPSDRERYQTVFAREPGAVAAPTAGLHFMPRTFEALKRADIQVTELVLHVGPGTFRPIQTRWVHEHRLDPEWYMIPETAWSCLESCRARGGRTLAVGTTVVRALETAVADGAREPRKEGWTKLLIAPPFEFNMVDALLTNFHLPASSLLALVAAFAGLELTMDAYRAAVEARYRFYSYGDAMLIV